MVENGITASTFPSFLVITSCTGTSASYKKLIKPTSVPYPTATKSALSSISILASVLYIIDSLISSIISGNNSQLKRVFFLAFLIKSDCE